MGPKPPGNGNVPPMNHRPAENKQPGESLAHPSIPGVGAPTSMPLLHQRKVEQSVNIEQLRTDFVRQRSMVSRLETELLLATHAKPLGEHMERSDRPYSVGAPVLVVHVGGDGTMTSLIPVEQRPTDEEGYRELQESAAKIFAAIDHYYQPEIKRKLQQQFFEARRVFSQTELKFNELGVPLPLDDQDDHSLYLDPVLNGAPPESHASKPTEKSKSGLWLNQEPSPTDPMTSVTEDGSLVDPYEFCLRDDPVLQSLYQRRGMLYTQDRPRNIDVTGNLAVFLRRSGDPAAGDALVDPPLAELADVDQSHTRQDERHSARKAILFRLLMNFLKEHQHPVAQLFPNEAVYAYQIGLAATRPNTQALLNGQGSKKEHGRCCELLSQTECVDESVAAIIASDVTGFQPLFSASGQPTLTTALIRDIEMLEMCRFKSGLRVEDLYTYKLLEQSYDESDWSTECEKVTASLHCFCAEWLQGYRGQNELADDFVLHSAVGKFSIASGTVPAAAVLPENQFYTDQKRRMALAPMLRKVYDFVDDDMS